MLFNPLCLSRTAPRAVATDKPVHVIIIMATHACEWHWQAIVFCRDYLNSFYLSHSYSI